ncbi:fibronectin type III domain-containing protein [Pseudozobellia sp. WGM2]|uniref:fibronectin type III domain-containing protein n=1 Tax=Pseudozobellia sp. WGM2 TaxID=2787625 RepID=UPI001AE0DE55|nr:fibronectin type III domain-containing protein [Pseudozobellia sp. WGM2]
MLSKTVKHYNINKNGRLVSYRKATYLLLQTTILFLLLTLNLTTATAQSFPVQVIPQVTPPPPIYFSEYANENTVNSPLRVQLILNDFEIANREVRLRVSFEGSGISFQSKDLVTGASPLFLEGGVPLVLTNVELAPYFRYENLNGISGNVYGNAIPEGAYNFCFEVFDVLTGSRLSQKSCAISVVFQNEPPFLVSPRNKTNVEEINPQNIIFQWTPRHVNVSNVEYELSIVEIWDTQVDPQQAFLSSPPVFQTVTNATTYVYGPADPLFLSGKNYAWRVQAKAKQGLEEVGLFENQGYSEIYSFSYAGSCDLPFGINHEVKGSTNANIFWDDFSTDVPEYTLRYRQKNVEGAEWFTNKTSGNQTTLWDLKPGTVYEYQVQKQCTITGSDWSVTKQFTTFIADVEAAVYDCNITPNFNLSNKEPLANLYAGDAFKAGDFPIKVLETSGSNGRFTGKGYVTIPYLNSIRVGVAFTNVLVNTDNQLVEGSVLTVYDPNMQNILDIDEAVDTVTDAVDAVGEFVEGDNDLDEIKVNSAIDKDDIKIEDGKVVITNPQNGVTKSEPLGDDMVITDSEGKTYYVDAEGEITEGGTIDQNGAITGNNVEGVSNNGQLESLTAKGIKVTFNEEGTYGMDIMPTGNIGTLAQEYTVIKDADGKDYPLTLHAVKKGATTKIKATIDLKNGDYKADDVSFKTKQGGSIPTTFNGSTATLTLTGRYSFENEVIYATVASKEDNSKQLTAGAFNLWHLTERSVNVALVSVNGASLGSIESNVSKIFEKAVANIQFGKSLSLSIKKSELGSNQTLDFGESAWAAAYNEEQKMLVNRVKQLEGYNASTYYILVFNDIEPSRPIGGFMPLQRQMGFVFGGQPEEEDKGGDKSKTLAHEIGHGIFALQHPFSEYGINEERTDWLMDYGSGDQLPHTHWAQIHDPSLKFYLFQEEEEGEIAGKIWFTPSWEAFSIRNSSTIISDPEHLTPKGTVPGFKLNDGTKYWAEYDSNGQFKGYYHNSSIQITDEEYKNKETDIGDEDTVYLFEYVPGYCNKTYQSTYTYVKSSATGVSFEELKNNFTEVDIISNCIPELCSEGKKFYDTYISSVIGESEQNSFDQLVDLICKNGTEYYDNLVSQIEKFNNEEKSSLIWKNHRYLYESLSESWWARDNAWEEYASILIEIDRIFKEHTNLQKVNTADLFFIIGYSTTELLSNLSANEKVEILQFILNNEIFITEGNVLGIFKDNVDDEEGLILKLIASVRKEECGEFLKEIRLRTVGRESIFENLFSVVHNAGGQESFTILIQLLFDKFVQSEGGLDSYIQKYKERETNFKWYRKETLWLLIEADLNYISKMEEMEKFSFQANFDINYFGSNTKYYLDCEVQDCSNIWGIVENQGYGFYRFENFASKGEYDAYDILTIEFTTPIEELGIEEGTYIPIPAFFFHGIIKNNNLIMLKEFLGDVVSVGTTIYAGSALLKATKGLTKVLSYGTLFYNQMNAYVMTSDVRNSLQSSSEGKAFLLIYETGNLLINLGSVYKSPNNFERTISSLATYLDTHRDFKEWFQKNHNKEYKALIDELNKQN